MGILLYLSAHMHIYLYLLYIEMRLHVTFFFHVAAPKMPF